MTKEQAERLAKHDKNYVAKRVKGSWSRNTGEAWEVWCVASEHWVEFDQPHIDAAK